MAEFPQGVERPQADDQHRAVPRRGRTDRTPRRIERPRASSRPFRRPRSRGGTVAQIPGRTRSRPAGAARPAGRPANIGRGRDARDAPRPLRPRGPRPRHLPRAASRGLSGSGRAELGPGPPPHEPRSGAPPASSRRAAADVAHGAPEELRKRIIWSLVGIAVAFFPCWSYAKEIYAFPGGPLKPFLPPGTRLAFLGLTDPFIMYFKMAGLAALFVASPFVSSRPGSSSPPALPRSGATPCLRDRHTLFFLAGGAFATTVPSRRRKFLLGSAPTSCSR